jgi:hypothetical protein
MPHPPENYRFLASKPLPLKSDNPDVNLVLQEYHAAKTAAGKIKALKILASKLPPNDAVLKLEHINAKIYYFTDCMFLNRERKSYLFRTGIINQGKDSSSVLLGPNYVTDEIDHLDPLHRNRNFLKNAKKQWFNPLYI